MAAQVPATKSVNCSWEIDKDAFAPPSTRRIIRGWDREPVLAHVPRLLGRKVWKQVALKPVKAKAVDDVQEELERDGTGARKKSRIISAKENIGHPVWDDAVLGGSNERGLLDFQKEKDNEVHSPAMENNVSVTPQKSSTISNLQFVPRKRTNTNHVITPKKLMRQTTLKHHTQREPFAESAFDAVNSPLRRRKSSRKSVWKSSIRISTGVETSLQLPETFDYPKKNDNETLHVNEPETEAAMTEMESFQQSIRGSGASAAHVGEPSEPLMKAPNETLTGMSLTTTIEKTRFISSPNVIRGWPTEVISNESPSTDKHNTVAFATLNTISAGEDEDSRVEQPIRSFSDKPISLESEDPSSEFISELNPYASKNIQDTSMGKITNDPTTIVQNKLETSTPLDVTSDAKDPVTLASIKNCQLRDNFTTNLTHLTEPLEGHIIAPHVSISPSQINGPDLFVATSPQLESRGAEEPFIVESKAIDKKDIETPDQKASDLADAILANAPTTAYDHDYDDTDMLRNFLTRVQANKAAKKSPPERKRSLPHSPLRIPLGEMDNNLSPSPIKSTDGSELTESSPLESKKGSLYLEGLETKTCRRSGRTRLPTKAVPSAPSFIPVRRLGQDVETTVTLKRNEEKEIAVLTRVNTRKNKGAALSAAEVLAKKNEEKEDPAMRQRLLKEVFNEKVEKDKQFDGKKRRGKNVTWAEELARFQTMDKGKAEQTKSNKEKEKSVRAEEGKKQGAVRVGVRSKMALGMAVNGTPAPKRKVRGRA